MPAKSYPATGENFPVIGSQALNDLGVQRLVLVEKGNGVLAMIGIGTRRVEARSLAEDEQILSSVSNELASAFATPARSSKSMGVRSELKAS